MFRYIGTSQKLMTDNFMPVGDKGSGNRMVACC